MSFLTANASLENMFDELNRGLGEQTREPTDQQTQGLGAVVGWPVGVACVLGVLALLVWLVHKYPEAWNRLVQDLRDLSDRLDRLVNRLRAPAAPPRPPMASPRNQTDEERLGRQAARVLAAATAAECPERAGARSEWV